METTRLIRDGNHHLIYTVLKGNQNKEALLALSVDLKKNFF